MICNCGGVTVDREVEVEEGYRQVNQKCPKCGRYEICPKWKLTELDIKIEKLKKGFLE